MRGKRWMRSVGAAVFLWALAMPSPVLATATSSATIPSRDHIVEFQLEQRWISSLAQAPDGSVLYSGYSGAKGSQQGVVGRVGPGGPVGATPVPITYPGQIAVGPEGDAWLAGKSGVFGRLSPAGVFTEVTARNNESEQRVAAAAGGGVWFTQRDDRTYDSVGRIDAAGALTEVPIPTFNAGPAGVVEGKGGEAWFTEFFAAKIGRVEPSGQLTEYQLPAGTRPSGITVDAKGNAWFGETPADKIGRISPDGKLTQFPLPAGIRPADAIAAGTDGRIWFNVVKGDEYTVAPVLGRIDPAGRYTEVPLPDAESEPVDLLGGSEGKLWYAAMGEPACIGGGASCGLFEPQNPAIVGRVKPAPLRVAPVGWARVHRDRLEVPVTCSGGDGSDVCRGALEIRIGGKAIARTRYAVPVDSAKRLSVNRVPRIKSLLPITARKKRALAVFSPKRGIGKDFRVVFRLSS